MRYFLTLVFLLCSILSFSQKNEAKDPFIKLQPVPHKAVNDFDKFLTARERDSLEKELAGYRAETGNSIVFISINSLTSPKTKKQYTIEEAALLYFNTWGIGDSIMNNGVLVIVSRQPRRLRIEVGKGLEDVLTNDVCETIISEKLVPHFKQGSFYLGIKEALIDIKQTLDNPPAPAVATPAESTTIVEYETTQSDAGWATLFGGVGVLFFVSMFGVVGYFILKGLLENKNNAGNGNSSRSSMFFRGRNNINSSDDSPAYGSGSNNDWPSSNDNAVASFSSFDSSPSSSSDSSSSSSSDSSSSSSADSGSSSGGSSDGGGASGSW